MSIQTVFPTLPIDIAQAVFGYMTPKDLVALSGINKLAKLMLSNQYFEKLFVKKYPLLAGWAFLQLRTYPEHCWKVACCSMDTEYSPFKKEFLEKPLEEVALSFQTKKAPWETKLEELCGSGYEDPNSPNPTGLGEARRG